MTARIRAGHGSVRAGFGPFGHPTRSPRVFKISTHNIKENVENWQVLGSSDRVFLVGLVGLVGWIGYFKVIFKTKKLHFIFFLPIFSASK
jgi:hypothetical protein